MRIGDEMLQRSRGAKLVRRVFQRNRHAARLRKHGETIQRSERRIQLARIRRLPAMPDMLDQILEWNLLRDVQYALNLVHRIQATDALWIGYGNHHAALAAWRVVAVGRRMDRMQPQAIFVQCISDLAHSLRAAITEMLRSAENFHR